MRSTRDEIKPPLELLLEDDDNDDGEAMEAGGEMRVAIVGAGSAGMVMAKTLKEVAKSVQRPISYRVFERRSNVGGIWQLDADPGSCWLAGEDPTSGRLIELPKQGSGRLRVGWNGSVPPGPMFQGLRTNIPSDLMAYRDVPFREGTDLFPSREIVQSYLEEYGKELMDENIQLNTEVISVTKEGECWKVKSRGQSEEEDIYTHVVVASGRCNTPNIPNIPGLQRFKGKIMHSAWYRDPCEFRGKTVLVVGNASSGMDIARELVGYITRTLPSGYTPETWPEQVEGNSKVNVISSWESLEKPPPMDFNPLDPSSPEWCRKVQVRGRIKEVDEDGAIVFEEGEDVKSGQVDVIVFATGFLFDFPFLKQNQGALVQAPILPHFEGNDSGGRPSSTMFNLDDWLLFHARDETICFLGMPVTVVPFPLTDAQARYAANRWAGLCPPLLQLDTTIPPTDASRWTSKSATAATSSSSSQSHVEEVRLEPVQHVFGYPSDVAYVDELMRMLPGPTAGKEAPWDKGNAADKGPRERGPEKDYLTTSWRRDRRANGKTLRRATLGY